MNTPTPTRRFVATTTAIGRTHKPFRFEFAIAETDDASIERELERHILAEARPYLFSRVADVFVDLGEARAAVFVGGWRCVATFDVAEVQAVAA